MVFPLAIIFYRFLFLLLVLEPIIALPWLTRRDMTWSDSPGQAIIDMGAAALNGLSNQLTLPTTETEYPPDPSQPQPEAPNTPEWSTPPLFEPNPLKRCSAVTQFIGAPDDQLYQLPGEGDILTPNELAPISEKKYEDLYVPQNAKTG